jgi:hypothetical protein
VQLGLDIAGKTKFREVSESEFAENLPQDVQRRRTAVIIGWIFGFYIAIWLLGFSLAVPVMIILYLKIAGREKWPIAILLALIAWGFFYGLFDHTLHVPFPDPLIPIPYLNT